MTKKENITEKQVFDYVFRPERLSNNLIRMISTDAEFRSKVEYYESLKSLSRESDLDSSLLYGISKKIPLFKEEKVIELYPAKTGMDATGIMIQPYRQISSFIDAFNNYYVHIENQDPYSKVFLFSIIQQVINSCSLTFIPSGNIIKLENNLEPALIDRQDRIDLIKLELR